MFAQISKTIPRDNDFADRVYNYEIRKRLLDGTFYDQMRHEFFQEKHHNGEHIPLRERSPCVQYNLPQIIVKDSVSFLFGEGRFPTIDSPDKNTRECLETVVKQCRLQQTMIESARSGSVGSVAVLMRVLKNSVGENRIYFEVVSTQFLTPVYDPNAPDTLIQVVQKFKVKGADLAATGYSINPDHYQMDFWFQRIFDQTSETYFQPMLVSESKADSKSKQMIEDADRQVKHSLGFVPVVWIKNLPGGGTPIDGACTFEQAIKIGIEIDYQLSQVGRGLKYSGDPMLVLKGLTTATGSMQRDASQAVLIDTDGDAKLLELNGGAAATVIDYCRTLREMALEACGGNRTPIDKLSLPQSGKAMEMLFLPLIMLADTLRGSYGEHGLKAVLQMVLKAQAKLGNLQAGDIPLPKIIPGTAFSLRWPDFFAATDADRQQQAQSLGELVASGLMSRPTAVKTLSQRYDIENVSAEIQLIEADQKRREEEAAATAVTAKKNIIPNE